MHSAQQIEQQLIRGIKRILVPYRRALAITQGPDSEAHQDPTREGSPETTPLEGPRSGEIVDRLRPVMEMIAEMETTLRPIREQWTSLNASPGETLQRLLGEQAEVLQSLMTQIDQIEAQMLATRDALLPDVDSSAEQQKVRQVYRHAHGKPFETA